MTDTDLFTKASAARWVGVTPQAVADRIRLKKLPAQRIAGVELVTRADLERWKADRQDRGRKLLGTP